MSFFHEKSTIETILKSLAGHTGVLEKGDEPMTIRVLIVDDYPIVRAGLRTSLGRDANIEIVAEASNGAEAIELAQALRPDIVLMDWLLPDIDGPSATMMLH